MDAHRRRDGNAPEGAASSGLVLDLSNAPVQKVREVTRAVLTYGRTKGPDCVARKGGLGPCSLEELLTIPESAEVVEHSNIVICSRTTPNEKAQLVTLLRDWGKITLASGIPSITCSILHVQPWWGRGWQ